MPNTLSPQARSMERRVTIRRRNGEVLHTWITRTEAASVIAHGNRKGFPETSARAAYDAAIVEAVKVRFSA